MKGNGVVEGKTSKLQEATSLVVEKGGKMMKGGVIKLLTDCLSTAGA